MDAVSTHRAAAGTPWLETVQAGPLDAIIAAAKHSMSYLASPIGDGQQTEKLLGMASRVAVWFKGIGCPVFSPAAYITRGAPPPQGWYKWDMEFMRAAKRLIILDIPPHTARSIGCCRELAVARGMGVPTYRLPWSMVEGELG